MVSRPCAPLSPLLFTSTERASADGTDPRTPLPKPGRDDVEQPRKREELVIPELSGSPGSTAATNRQGDKPAAEEDNDRNNAWTHVNVTAVKRRQKIDGGPDVKVSEPTSNEQRGGEALSRLVPRAIAKSRAGDQK